MDIETYQDKVCKKLGKMGIESERLENNVKFGMNGWQIIVVGFDKGLSVSKTSQYIFDGLKEIDQ